MADIKQYIFQEAGIWLWQELDDGTYAPQVILAPDLAGRGAVMAIMADVHSPAANTIAIVTYAAVADRRNVISGVMWGYDADPTGGILSVTIAASVVRKVYITKGGPGFLHFDPPIASGINEIMEIVLTAGGAAVTGVVQAEGHWLAE